MAETIDIAELAAAQLGLAVVAPPTVLQPAATAPAGAPLQVVAEPAIQASLQAVNAQVLEVQAVACRFVRDVAVMGAGYVFHGPALVTDGSHLSDVATEWVRRPMPDSPIAAQPARERVIENLAVAAVAPGHLIYGHWLVDFVPRFMVAQKALGAAFATARLVLPHDTPRWALAMLEAFTGAGPGQYEFYERGVERLALRHACIPTYVHNNYAFHPYAAEIFAEMGGGVPGAGTRKLCISRVAFEGATHGVQKLFHTRALFEDAAAVRGYEVVRPETMAIREQIALFASASHVVGEYGSALHSAVFSPRGLRAGFIRCPNPIQLRIAALMGQSSAIVVPADDRVGAGGVMEYSLTPAEMSALLDANEI